VTSCDICLDTSPALDEYASVPIAFEVSEVLDANDLAGTPSLRRLTVRREPTPYVKDYPPMDLTGCSIFAATQDNRRVGGVAVQRRDAAIPRRLGYRQVLTIENEMFGPTGSLRDTMVWQTP
jgi:hypothetical protein